MNTLPEYFEFNLATRVVFGFGLLGNLGTALEPFGHRRALLVTDPVLRRSGPVEQVVSAFADSNIEIVAIFDQVPPNSTLQAVETCAAQGRAAGCDLLLAVGGGSVIDTAKVANILLVKGGAVEQHMGAYLLGDTPLLPCIVVPTTAGTGSEVTKVAVIADTENDVKLPFAEHQFLPELAILDPEVTRSMPAKLTAMTGMDALTHAIEAFVDKEWSPASDALALEAIRLIDRYLLVACVRPDDLEARAGMAVASCLAGIAFSHSMVGMTHGIAHALGGVYHIPHGLANALVLSEVMNYNLSTRVGRYARVAEAMGIRFPQPTARLGRLAQAIGMDTLSRSLSGWSGLDRWFERRAARAAIDRVRYLNRCLAGLTGMPLNLRSAGVEDGFARLEQVVTTAMEDGAMLYNPCEPTADAVRDLLKTVYARETRPLTPKIAPAGLGPSRMTGAPARGQAFDDDETLYRVLGGFFESLKEDPTIGPALLGSRLCVQFRYRNPEAVITIDARGDAVRIHCGTGFDDRPEVSMSMNADVAHRFWHGKVNLVTALTRRQIQAKGNVPKTLKLLPILKPAFGRYPAYLASLDLEHLILQ